MARQNFLVFINFIRLAGKGVVETNPTKDK
jgi:hypothetical protein